MSYSQGIARFADLFVSGAAQGPDAAAFLAPICPPGSSVLDIGAGAGATTFALASRGVNVVALEPDPEMYTVLLSRLALRPELHEFAAPLPRPAGLAIVQTFDVVCSFSVIHLLRPAERLRLVRYALGRTRRGGKVVLEIPVASRERLIKPWQLVATRKLGAVDIEFHSAMEPAGDGWWYTRWKFTTVFAGDPVDEVHRSFHWYPLAHAEATVLLAEAGVVPSEEYGGYDRSAYVPDESRVRLIVAHAP